MLNNLSKEEKDHLYTLFTHRGSLGSKILIRELQDHYESLSNLAASGKIEGHELSHKLGQALTTKKLILFLEEIQNHQ